MVFLLVVNKFKHLLLVIVGLLRRALCCFRRRRRPSFDAIPLTDVVSNRQDDENWNWEEKGEFSEPKTIQDHIDLYRKRKVEAQRLEEPPNEDFFEDMAPRITRQTKLLIGGAQEETARENRLNLTALETGELREWEESSGWEGDSLDWDAQNLIREKKRQERERKIMEQQQKRLEKHKYLGEKLTS